MRFKPPVKPSAGLRWFFEELPQLPVAAAGSLLDFALADHAFSMPVGRISFQNIEPMGLPEYLSAHGQQRLLDAIRAWLPAGAFRDGARAGHPLVLSLRHGRRHAGGGGGGCRRTRAAPSAGIQKDLVATYCGDFAKYSGRMDRHILDVVLNAVAISLGRKFVYAHVYMRESSSTRPSTPSTVRRWPDLSTRFATPQPMDCRLERKSRAHFARQ